jgi:hypothetical protein
MFIDKRIPDVVAGAMVLNMRLFMTVLCVRVLCVYVNTRVIQPPVRYVSTGPGPNATNNNINGL